MIATTGKCGQTYVLGASTSGFKHPAIAIAIPLQVAIGIAIDLLPTIGITIRLLQISS